MGKTLSERPRKEPRSVDAIAKLLQGSRKMPRAKAKRLSELLDKGNCGRLSTDEDRELSGLVEQVQRQTFLMIARAVARRNQEDMERSGRASSRVSIRKTADTSRG